ncbi:MAG: hypothetical protein AB4050_01775 [Synechococcus sp.]
MNEISPKSYTRILALACAARDCFPRDRALQYVEHQLLGEHDAWGISAGSELLWAERFVKEAGHPEYWNLSEEERPTFEALCGDFKSMIEGEHPILSPGRVELLANRMREKDNENYLKLLLCAGYALSQETFEAVKRATERELVLQGHDETTAHHASLYFIQLARSPKKWDLTEEEIEWVEEFAESLD